MITQLSAFKKKILILTKKKNILSSSNECVNHDICYIVIRSIGRRLSKKDKKKDGIFYSQFQNFKDGRRHYIKYKDRDDLRKPLQ